MEPLKISAKNLGAVALADFCPRCYYIKLKMNNKLPYQSFPGIFSSIDAYTKHCAHYIIDKVDPKPFWMQSIGDIYRWEPVPHWKKNTYLDEKSGITLSGMADDIWITKDNQRIVPDYKTAKHTDTQDKLFPMYEIQNNVYSILLKADILYLVYMEPITEKDAACGNIIDVGFNMGFNAVVVPVERDRAKVRNALSITREIYEMHHAPKGRDGCKECESLDKIIGLLGMGSVSNPGLEE